MNLKFILLGLAQGVSEFLPISSSGHLVLIQNIFNLKEMLFFDIIVHFASLIAILLVFRKRFLSLTVRKILFLFIASIPTMLLYLVLKQYIGSLFNDLDFIWLFFLLTGCIIYSTKFSRPKKDINLISAILIGIAQALALFPGVSRSGATISVGLLHRLQRKEAVEFSFMLGAIAILGATLLEYKEIVAIDNVLVFPTVLGFFASLIASIIALKIVVKFVENSQFYRFGYYCWFMAGVSLSVKFFF
ncbi:MAG: undecaprenyl-diphosphate phosphatase [Candidatus Gygaella obscura]|nr:undecaprenyl-diphosphate phosphatase [Candidatus Gygaella obscura]